MTPTPHRDVIDIGALVIMSVSNNAYIRDFHVMQMSRSGSDLLGQQPVIGKLSCYCRLHYVHLVMIQSSFDTALVHRQPSYNSAPQVF